ncbi:hypothetical protein MMC30_007751 [Trapelia coarctata]|nr:hypothetical protein [Trapelia coarctata]
MSSYLSSLTTHYSSLRRLLPTSLSEDADLHVNSEQDSHVSRVLRAYYTEKGRPFPAWLGPDPNASSRAPIPALAISSASSTGPGSLRSGRAASGQSGGGGGGGGGLGDLFADSPGQGNNNSAESLSLRQRRPNLRSPGFKGGSSDSIPYPQRVAQAPASQSPYSSSRNTPVSQANIRPLPSQREGSYQTRPGMGAAPSTTSVQSTSSTGSSVQERLKARLGGGSRGTSPVFNNSNTPPPPSSSSSGGKEYDPYSSSNYNLNGGGSSFNPYEDSGSSGSRKNPYASASDEGRQPYGSSSTNKRGDSKAPYMGATSPWVEDGYGGRGASSDYSGGSSSFLSGRRGPGLPSSPRRNR